MPTSNCCTCRDIEDDWDPACPVHGNPPQRAYETLLDEDERHDR